MDNTESAQPHANVMHLPLHAEPASRHPRRFFVADILDATGYRFAQAIGASESEANERAALVATACNQHADDKELMREAHKALQDMMRGYALVPERPIGDIVPGWHRLYGPSTDTLYVAHAALAKLAAALESKGA